MKYNACLLFSPLDPSKKPIQVSADQMSQFKLKLILFFKIIKNIPSEILSSDCNYSTW